MNPSSLHSLLDQVRDYIPNPTKGLPEEVFLFATEITPMVNVDLLIRDADGNVLLSWRDDPIDKTGWHIPGGIVRVKETFEERIQQVGILEIGCPSILFDPKPLEIVPILLPERKQRCHFISFVYSCHLPERFVIDNGPKKPHDKGYLQWHRTFPSDMISPQNFYKKYFQT